MPNGGEHHESLGVCPLCRSPRIRIRRQRHRILLWRCRGCKRVFRTPSIAEYILPPGDPGRGYVSAQSIPQMERRARLHRRRRTRRISGLVKLVATATFVLLMGAVGWYLVFMDGLGRGGDPPNQHPVGAGTPKSVLVSPIVPPAEIPGRGDGGPNPTVLPTEIPGRSDLYEPILPPMAPAHVNWRWESDKDYFREVVTDFTVHNDVGDWSDDHGFYLILMQNSISGTGFYFGLQTDANRRGKGLIFSRWGTRDLTNARFARVDGWTQSSGHEGDFIGVRRSYEWGKGDYRVRIAPDGWETDGEWFGLWITDLSTSATTWIGSLKFPLPNGTATMEPYAIATIELYGTGPIRPIDVPQWHVSVKRPLGDNVPAEVGFTRYPYDKSENALPNSDVWYDPLEDRVHLLVGGTTERKTPASSTETSS